MHPHRVQHLSDEAVCTSKAFFFTCVEEEDDRMFEAMCPI